LYFFIIGLLAKVTNLQYRYRYYKLYIEQPLTWTRPGTGAANYRDDDK